MKSDGADCFVFSGITANGAVQLYKDVAAALPDAKLYGPDGVAESGFADPKEGGVPVDVGNRIKVSVATLAPDEYPPEGKKFFSEFEKEYGEPNPDPYSIYGFEAMDLFLDTCKELADDVHRQAGGDRRDVPDQGTQVGARHVRHRRERRHHAHRLRDLPDQGRRARSSTRRSRPQAADRKSLHDWMRGARDLVAGPPFLIGSALRGICGGK